jgi:hypothetical protein
MMNKITESRKQGAKKLDSTKLTGKVGAGMPARTHGKQLEPDCWSLNYKGQPLGCPLIQFLACESG